MRFFMIDKITEWHIGQKAKAIKNVAFSEDFFDDHFPRRPIMPGVLIVEGLAQLSGLLLEASLKKKYGKNAKAILTVLERTKFREVVRPGDSLNYCAEVTAIHKGGGKTSVQALCESRIIATSGMTFAFKYIDDPMLEAMRNALMKVWLPQ